MTVEERMTAIYGSNWQYIGQFKDTRVQEVFKHLEEMQAENDRLRYEKDEAVKRLLSYQETAHKINLDNEAEIDRLNKKLM